MASDPERQGDEMEDLDDDKESLGGFEQIGDEPQILNRPDFLAKIQGRLSNTDAVLQSLPAPVKRRIKALKKLQLETANIEAKFYQEVHELECKYHNMYYPLYEKRANIVTGVHEPNDDECEFPSDDEKDEDVTTELKTKLKIEDAANEKDESQKDVRGVPDFWLTIFKNVGMLSDMVEAHDEPILKHLVDIKVLLLKSPMGFVLEFHFSPNEYFSNSVLTKEYEMKCVPDENDPFSFEGPEIYKCKGCVIDWKKGKNVTVKTVKKRQKHKSRGSMRTIMKTIQNDSFFNFFTPPCMPEDPDAEIDEDTQSLLTTDFEIGHYIRERIIQRAVLYYTGEALEDEDDYEEEGEEDEEDDDEEEEDEDEEGVKTGGSILIKETNHGQPGDCKQQ
ncbi:nucleosome assembly protein 1 [Lycorma delicatula]|uniref:nucleosome assembly protein 1 n=1 Tax=Lycorma delicatula TaxID=130591 RepID=UPI003F511F16